MKLLNEILGTKYPIIQGGMAWVAEHHLAAAVSEAGGLGLIGASAAPAEWVRNEIREAKKLTDKPFGVNIMLMSPYAEIYGTVEKRWYPRHPGGRFRGSCKTNGARRRRCRCGRRM